MGEIKGQEKDSEDPQCENETETAAMKIFAHYLCYMDCNSTRFDN